MSIWMKMNLKSLFFKETFRDKGKIILDSEHPLVVYTAEEPS